MGLFVDIRKDFGAFRLAVAFEAPSGSVTGLLGASGCGKSLTLRCIAGIERPDSGRIELDGRTLFDRARRIDCKPQKRRVGYLFQHYALFPHMTVAQNVGVGVRDRALRAALVSHWLEALRLQDQAGQYPRQLSGGQQQRTALARILASEPAALLLDEPFSALDRHLQWQVEAELDALLDRFAGPVVFVTHDRDEARRLCGQVCVLEGGASQPVQPTDELFRAPRTRSACLLTGCENLSRVHALPDGRVQAEDWAAALAVSAPLPAGLTHIGIPAHACRPADGPGPNRIPCRVERMWPQAHAYIALLRTPGGAAGASLLRIELDRACWQPGDTDTVWIELPAQAILPLTGP